MLVRIHAYLAQMGFGSRREIEAWIKKGYVHVNGKPCKLGVKVDAAKDEIKIKGRPVVGRSPKPIVVALHKPRGVVSTAKDPEGRKTVLDLGPKGVRLFPVGRLDIQSEGLILLTNDGELAQQITHPKFEVPKVYEVRIRGNFDDKKMAYLQKGMTIDNERMKPAEILSLKEVTREGVKKFQVTIQIFEGKNHHIRNLFEALKCHVIRLKRVSIGAIALKGIPRGEYRLLTVAQVDKLKKSVGL